MWKCTFNNSEYSFSSYNAAINWSNGLSSRGYRVVGPHWIDIEDSD